MRVGTCVIGVGRMGSNHARCLTEMEEAELLAISDPDAERRRELAARFGCREYAEHESMLAAERPDAVVLAVPTPLHLSVALDVISRGCHVLVEKPLADRPANAERIIEAAREAGVRLAVGHIERFNPAVRKLKEVIDEGALGRVLSVSAKRVGLPSAHYLDTNVVVDLAVHDMDVMRFLLGTDLRVVSSVTGRLVGGPSEDYADILLLAGDVPCVVQVNWVTPVKIRTLSVIGSAGYAEMNYITQTVQLYRRQTSEPQLNYRELVATYGEAETETVHAGGEEPLKEELRAFFRAVRDGTEPEVSGPDGLAAVELADAALGVARQVPVL
ncbi:MAG TPA: Gfo/Idh/MocA family oxidoreductase [Dehalococcoidia bacterium]|nr:Gfo/Idh/MocA family oxidoreductase [Dehalococcoidia bacterium]